MNPRFIKPSELTNLPYFTSMKTRKELKQAYAQIKHPMGVFQIKNISNGKLFIGSSVNLPAMWNRQRMQLKSGTHVSKSLQEDWDRMGEDHFIYEILEEIRQDEDKDYTQDLTALESMYLESLQPWGDKGYNRQRRG